MTINNMWECECEPVKNSYQSLKKEILLQAELKIVREQPCQDTKGQEGEQIPLWRFVQSGVVK